MCVNSVTCNFVRMLKCGNVFHVGDHDWGVKSKQEKITFVMT